MKPNDVDRAVANTRGKNGAVRVARGSAVFAGEGTVWWTRRCLTSNKPHVGFRTKPARTTPRAGDWLLARLLLGLGSVFEIQSMMIKDHESSAVSHAITALAMRLARRELAPLVTAQLRLCYVLPGEDGRPPFAGMRLSAHDSATQLLVVEASVPTHIVHDPKKAGPYVLAVAADAIDAADAFFVELGVSGFEAELLQAWVATVQPKELLPPRNQQVRNTDFDWS